MLVAGDQTLARAKSADELVDPDTWADLLSAVNRLAFAIGPNWAFCSFTVAFRALVCSYPACDGLAESEIHNKGVVAASWLTALQLGITPILAFWLALANQRYLVDAGLFRKVLLDHFAGNPRQLLYFIDEVSLRTRIESKVWKDVYPYNRNTPQCCYLSSLCCCARRRSQL